jgi:hypothetical protein
VGGLGGGGGWMMDSPRLLGTRQVSLNMLYNVSLRIRSNLVALDQIILSLMKTNTFQRLNYLLHMICNKTLKHFKFMFIGIMFDSCKVHEGRPSNFSVSLHTLIPLLMLPAEMTWQYKSI